MTRYAQGRAPARVQAISLQSQARNRFIETFS
ncbi:MAG: hypothetical protein RL735_1469, partial [Pseudomonadota bacterium]